MLDHFCDIKYENAIWIQFIAFINGTWGEISICFRPIEVSLNQNSIFSSLAVFAMAYFYENITSFLEGRTPSSAAPNTEWFFAKKCLPTNGNTFATSAFTNMLSNSGRFLDPSIVGRSESGDHISQEGESKPFFFFEKPMHHR